MKSAVSLGLVVAATCLSAATVAQAAFTDPNLPGVTDFDGWNNLSRDNPQIASATPAFPGFPGGTLWPEPIESNLIVFDDKGTPDLLDDEFVIDDPTGDAYFDKLSGNGYPAGFSIYASPFPPGATYEVSDDTPVAAIETVIFQIAIGAGSSGWLVGDTASLTINETTSVSLAQTLVNDLGAVDTGFGPVPVREYLFQWDLTGLGPVTSFDVNFSPAGTSSTITALQLDQGDSFVLQVPEPTAVALVGIGAFGLFARRRRG